MSTQQQQHNDTTMMPLDADNPAPNDAPAAGPGQLMSSFFPSPPAYYKQYTSANLALARRLTGHVDFTSQADDWKSQQANILDLLESVSQEDKESVADIDLRTLVQPPDVEVVEQDGHWNAFGQVWPIKEKLPGLEDMGVKQMYEAPKTFQERRKALHTLLHTILHTYLRLLQVLTSAPPSLAQEMAQQASGEYRGTQADSLVEHIRLCSINVHHLCNEWRPVQARETMKLLLRNQIQSRKERTAELKAACADIQGKLDGLKTKLPPGQDTEALSQSVDELKVSSTATITATEEGTSGDSKASDAAKEAARKRLQEALDAIGS